ncbi:MAG: hypothetical protein Q8M94_10655, partial [Ignavibacteria bacterium]|nr:hypothetical protein [Ignavibacteria bacterium]
KFYPFSWGGNSGVTIQSEYNPETGIVFTTTNAVATGVLKGQLMSNSTTGISSNSQRKMVRTDNGIYHVVYESMGSVFYTYSLTSNFAGSWSIDEWLTNNAKNPAIEYEANNIIIVFELNDPDYSTNAVIYMIQYVPNVAGIYVPGSYDDVAYYPTSYFGSAKPVIAYNNGQIFVAYRKNSTEGLKERTKWFYPTPGSWVWSEERTIPETDANSINPAVAEKYGHIHIAFESLSTIKYKYGFIMDTRWNYDPVVNLSTGSGFNQNVNPSISLSTGTTTYVMVSWLGVYTNIAEKILPKEQDLYRRYAAVSKVGYGTGWGGFSNFSNNVNYTNNNSLNTSAGSILAWSESNGLYSKYVKRRSNGTYDPITSLSSNGIQTLVSNGSGFDNIKAMVFNSLTSVPYLLNKCT